jgi:hypothetical protein
MARAARTPKEDDTGEIKAKDYALAKKLYQHDIKPAVSRAGEAMQEASTGFKAIKKQAHIQPQAAKLAFKLADMEEAKRDDFLRCLGGLLKEFGIEVAPKDMIDMMQGEDGYARPKPQLVTIPGGAPSDGSETDLADSADFEEATEDELAQQEGRPASGTGATAIAAMKDAKG